MLWGICESIHCYFRQRVSHKMQNNFKIFEILLTISLIFTEKYTENSNYCVLENTHSMHE